MKHTDSNMAYCRKCLAHVTAKEVTIDKNGDPCEPRWELRDADGNRHECKTVGKP